MNLDELLQELRERGWELHYLRSLDNYGWEAYVEHRLDEDHVYAVGHCHSHSPFSAVDGAMQKLEREPETKREVPDLSAIAPAEAPIDLLRALGIHKKPLGIKRRI